MNECGLFYFTFFLYGILALLWLVSLIGTVQSVAEVFTLQISQLGVLFVLNGSLLAAKAKAARLQFDK